MIKVFHVAVREFTSTVFSKAFLLGIVMTPVLILIAISGVILLMNKGGPKIEGSIAIIDRSEGGRVGPRLAYRFTPEALAKEEAAATREAGEAVDKAAKSNPALETKRDMAVGFAGQAAAQNVKKTAALTVEVLPADADAAKEKEVLARVDIHARAKDKSAPIPRVMLVVVGPETVAGTPGSDGTREFGKYEIFTAPKLDFEITQNVQHKIGESIVDARFQSDPRVIASGLSAEAIRGILAHPDANVLSVTTSGEKKNAGVAQMFIPMGFILLLFMSVMVSAQTLLTTTIEEKSNRVMEVLLSAVSPMQLMTGKVLGQMGVGMVILLLYSGAGIGGLIAFSMEDAVSRLRIVCLGAYFVIAYFTIASALAAIGSVVTDPREAQTLMTPVMMVMILPWILWMPISRDPNSVFAEVLSFLPAAGPFAMAIRIAGSEPIPTWQIPATIFVGALWAIGSAWAGAKIFRIGVLLYGKPPNFKTLVKWVRMA